MEIVQTLIFLVLFVFAWSLLLGKFRTKKRLLPPQNPLRRARWSGRFVLLILGMMFLLPSLFLGGFLVTQPESVTREIFQPAVEKEDSDSSEPEKLQSIHPLQQFLQEKPSVWKYVGMFAFAAVLVPITEEFIFRGVLQGWLDAREREMFPGKRNNGGYSVIIVAILFALMHFRVGYNEPTSETALGYTFLMTGIANLMILVFGTQFLQTHYHLNTRTVGWDLSHWRTDIPLGILGFLAVAYPTFLIQKWLGVLFQDRIAPDPFALLPIAFVFGILAWRTRRLLPSIVAHVSLNAFSILSSFAVFLSEQSLE